MSVLEWCAVIATAAIAGPLAIGVATILAMLAAFVLIVAIDAVRARWRRWKAARAARKFWGWR